MDHERYAWSPVVDRPPILWPGGARVAVWIVACLQWFPLDTRDLPLLPLGIERDSYPDLRSYTHRDYGNRVGVFRVMNVTKRFGVRATAAVNAAVCRRYPAVIEEGKRLGWEFVAHGLHMGCVHHAGLSAEEEAAILDESLATVRLASGQPVAGWLSPGQSQSLRTLDLLAERGVEFVCDWVNDDLPYLLNAPPRGLYAMPYPHELSDATIIWQNRHSPTEFVEQVRDQFDWLYREAERCGGRIFGLAVHPWIIGQPHRIRSLAEALTYILGHERIWPATASEILAAFRSQQGEGKQPCALAS
jgi:peptidoglycan/xylan/chitin deacetylase (PgdA/CDA1 family)